MRHFNTTGPVQCDKHYCLPPLERFDLDEILTLIAQEKYFVLHAPRQTGKTSALLALRDYLNRKGHYRCLYVNFEVGQGYRERINEAMTALLQEISKRARLTLGDQTADAIARDLIRQGAPSLSDFLGRWCEAASVPTVLLIDEIDALVGDTLITVLRQLRAGYDTRPAYFPSTVILCGVRDVRDYRIHSSQSQEIITGGSAFNIKAASLRLGDFSQADVERLLQQHTAETGQVFEPEALKLAWELTQGQPWLVNALANEATARMRAGRDRSQPITAGMILEAKENLILRRETHLDQLIDKLKEERVRRVIAPMLQGIDMEGAVSEDDLRYAIDLGLIRRTARGMQIANPIYGEIIPREGM
ncbi:MAG: ATP-binding protein [Caldilineales bacterium]|nr:ATP-binding protein [Caldilineales bacterium]